MDETHHNPRCCAQGRNTFEFGVYKRPGETLFKSKEGWLGWTHMVRQGTSEDLGGAAAFYTTNSHLFARFIWKVTSKPARGSLSLRSSARLRKKQQGQWWVQQEGSEGFGQQGFERTRCTCLVTGNPGEDRIIESPRLEKTHWITQSNHAPITNMDRMGKGSGKLKIGD